MNDARHYDAAPVELIETLDATLAVRRFGSGPALLLVHGFPLHGFTWRKVSRCSRRASPATW